MGQWVELVLRIDPGAAEQWAGANSAAGVEKGVAAGADPAARAKKRSGRARPRGGPVKVAAEALRAQLGATCVSPRTPVTRRVFAGDPCVVVDEEPGGRRVLALRGKRLVPGVQMREAQFDVVLDASSPQSERQAWPQAVRAALEPDSEAEPPLTVQVHREIWEWAPTPEQRIQIVVLDTFEAASAVTDAVPQCELHLTVACIERPGGRSHAHDAAAPVQPSATVMGGSPEGGSLPEAAVPPTVPIDDVPTALRTLFAGAQVLVQALPAFLVVGDLFSRDAPVSEAAEAVRAARVGLGGARTPHEALLAIGGNIALQWFGNEPGVRERSAPEFVHQMRVALRRLKTLLKTFSHWVDADWRERVAPELDWLGELLGAVRDLDVFSGSTLPALAKADTDAQRWHDICTAAAARRDEARTRLQDALRSPRYAALSLLWLEWFALQSQSRGPDDYRDVMIGDYAAKRVRKHYRRLTAEPPLTELDAAGRHRRRIAAKRLRYTLEYFESLASTKTRRRLAKQLARVQSVLGDGSDAATALRFLDALEAPPYQAGFARGWCEAINRATAQEAQRLLADLNKPKIVGRRGR